jgi:cytidyltransferase-like protein
MKIVYTAGVWDLLHYGHLRFLRESAKLGDILVVGVVDCHGVYKYKGIHPEQPARHRMEAIQRLPWVHCVVPQATTDPTDNLYRFRPAIMTHGDDWDRLKAGHETLEALGIEYRTVPYTEGISSTQLRRNHGA